MTHSPRQPRQPGSGATRTLKDPRHPVAQRFILNARKAGGGFFGRPSVLAAVVGLKESSPQDGILQLSAQASAAAES